MPSTMVQVPILMSPSQKRRLAQKANAANLTMAELLREGGERYVPADDPTLLDHMAKQVIRETKKTLRAIDKTLALVAESEARMLALAKPARKDDDGTHRACVGCLRQHHQAERQSGTTERHGRQAAVSH